MKNAINIAMILTLIPVVLHVAIQKQMEPEQVALVLIVSVFLIAGGKPLIKLISGIAGLYLFAREITGGIGEKIIFGQLLQLAIVLIGFYIMFRAIIPRSWKKDKE